MSAWHALEPVIASEAKQSRTVETKDWIASSLALLAMTVAVIQIQLSNSERMCVRILAARCARALRRFPPSERTRGRRESRVRAAPAVSCANMHKKTHTSIQVQRRQSGFPCAMVYGLLRALPGERLFLPPSPLRRFASQELDASTAASGPHDFAVRSSHARQSQLSRPPHPTARS